MKTKILAIPRVRQRMSFDCGVAAAASILRACGIRAPYKDMIKQVGANRKTGSLPSKLCALLNQLCPARVERHRWLTTLDVKNHLKAGRPLVVVIVANDARGRKVYWADEAEQKSHHYVIVCGYNDEELVVMDPAYGRYSRIPWPEFILRWRACLHPVFRKLYRMFTSDTLVVSGLTLERIKVDAAKLPLVN